MVNFTNLRSKALSLVALMALSSTAVFAQSGKSNFETATDAASLKGAKKIFLYDGTTATGKHVEFPFDASVKNGVVSGVSLAVQTEGEAINPLTGTFTTTNGANVGDLPFDPMASESSMDGNASYWNKNGVLNVFTRQNSATVVFDFSTKYLRDVRNLRMTLGENTMGGIPTMKTKWTLTTYVFDLITGELVPVNEIYMSQSGSNALSFVQKDVFSIGEGMADKTITLFINDKDNNTTDLLPYAIDNKIIRVVLTSDEPTPNKPGDHFLPALTIADCHIDFETPSIAVAVDNKGEFNAGMCFVSKDKGNLTFTAKNVTGGGAVAIGHSKLGVDFVENQPLAAFVYADKAAAAAIELKTVYDFQPNTITSGSFNYVASVNGDGTDKQSPIILSATSEAITYNSVPELYLAEDHIKYNDNLNEEKDVTISGKNMVCRVVPNYTAYELKTTDQRDPYANMVVEEHFALDTDGAIIPLTSEVGKPAHLHLEFDQMGNDISRDEAFIVRIDNNWIVENAYAPGKDFKGETFPTLIARGNVAQLWFTYDGKSVIGTPAVSPDNIFFSRHDPSQPFDDARYGSRVKTFMLHGADVTATTADNIATITLELGVGTLNTAGSDHLEMRYSLVDPTSAGFKVTDWTNATTGKLTYKLNTASAEAVQNFYTNGIPVYVQYVPRCDAFGAGQTAEAGYEFGWMPHEFVLSASATDGSGNHGTADFATKTVVNLYGDTRAVLASNMNEINSLLVMGGTQSVSPIGQTINDWYTNASVSEIKVPSFRKSYGDIYLNCENNLYWKVDSFIVAGYNLKKNVTIEQKHNTAYNGAFTAEVTMLAGSNSALSLTPNEFGELVAVVKVYFAKNDVEKIEKVVKAEDLFTVKSGEATIILKDQDKRADFDVTKDKKSYHQFFNIGGVNHNTVNGFNYKTYSEGAEVFGFIYQPWLSIGEVEAMDAVVGGNQVSTFWVRGAEFNPMNSRDVTIKVTKAGTPFTVAPISGTARINNAGSFAEQYSVTYTPVANNLCEKSNTITLTAQCAKAVSADVAGTPSWDASVNSGFKINELAFGDIHGSMAKVSWTPIAGATWYQVEVGHWKPQFTSEDVFISECKAAVGSDKIVVEVFNGTGKVINKDDMQVNYYLVFEKIDAATGKVIEAITPPRNFNLDNALLNTNATKDGWSYDAVSYTYNTEISNLYNYNVKLMQGGVQIDIFSFGQAGAHLSRTAAAVRDADQKIVKAATIKRNSGAFDQSAWETFHTSLPVAHFEWSDYTFFDTTDGGMSEMISKTSTTINNLKPNSTYDVRVRAYHDCIINGEGVRIPATTQKVNFLTMSELVTSTGNIEFSDEIGWPTGNGSAEVSTVNTYANDGKIFVAGAEGNVTICNILGAVVAQVSAETAAQGVAVNVGVYVVRVNGEKGVKCIVK